jgi:hypothetical protein
MTLLRRLPGFNGPGGRALTSGEHTLIESEGKEELQSEIK